MFGKQLSFYEYVKFNKLYFLSNEIILKSVIIIYSPTIKPILKFLQILRAVSIFQFFLVGLFLIASGEKKKISNMLLAGFLFSKAICYLGGFLLRYKFSSDTIPFIFIFSSAFDLLLGPFLYLYIRSLTKRDFKFTKLHAAHFILFGLYIVFYLPHFIHDGRGGLEYYFTNDLTRYIVQSIIYFQFIIYSAICLKYIIQQRQTLKNSCSSLDETKLFWLEFLFGGFILIWLSGYINHIGEYFNSGIIIPWEILIILIFVFANMIVFLGLKKPELLRDFSESEQVSKYLKTALSSEKKIEYKKQILNLMRENKPYLDPGITLSEFSNKVNIPSHYISQVLNSELNQNFYDFMNQWRIEESKIQLKKSSDRTILEILYNAGFNSKASFNRAFKKHTGMTPSGFKKKSTVKSY